MNLLKELRRRRENGWKKECLEALRTYLYKQRSEYAFDALCSLRMWNSQANTALRKVVQYTNNCDCEHCNQIQKLIEEALSKEHRVYPIRGTK